MTSLWRHDWQWNHIFHIDLWSTRWGRPPVQILAQSDHFLQFYSDFSVENQHFFQKMTKWRHDDVIFRLKYVKWKILTQNVAVSLYQGWLCKKPFLKSFLPWKEDKVRSQKDEKKNVKNSFFGFSLKTGKPS